MTGKIIYLLRLYKAEAYHYKKTLRQGTCTLDPKIVFFDTSILLFDTSIFDTSIFDTSSFDTSSF